MKAAMIRKRSGTISDTDSASSMEEETSNVTRSQTDDIACQLVSDDDDNNLSDSSASRKVRVDDRSLTKAATLAASARLANNGFASSSFHTNRLGETSLDGLVVFDLTNQPDGTACFSPHTIKTILDLKLLNIHHERQRFSFVQIRNQLAQRVAENVTVPALELSDGTHIVESWKIAEYLEQSHPQGHKLFGNSAATKRLAALLNDFGKVELAPHLGPLAMPGVYKTLDVESADYFIKTKIGQTRWNKISKLSLPEKQAHITQAVNKLEMIETMLRSEDGHDNNGVLVSNSYNKHFTPRSMKRKRSSWLAGGEEPSHADFVLFGWYVYTRAAGPTITRDIWHAHKGIQQWIHDMLVWCGPIANDFL